MDNKPTVFYSPGANFRSWEPKLPQVTEEITKVLGATLEAGEPWSETKLHLSYYIRGNIMKYSLVFSSRGKFVQK